MTNDLHQLLHDRASAADLPAPDLDAIVRDGDRRVRRRRAGAVLGGAVAVAAVGGLGFATLGSSAPTGDPVAVDPAGPVPVTGPADPAAVTWAIGSELRSPDGAVDVGHRIRSYVRTTAGFAFTDPDGVVYRLASGEVTELGRTDPRRAYLVADEDGTQAGWVDGSGEKPVFVVADLADGSVRRLDAPTEGRGTLPDERDPAYFFALDAGTAYVLDDRGAVAVDVATGASEVLDPDAGGFDLLDAEDGVVAASAGDAGTRVGDVLLPEVYGSIGALSPSAAWFTIDADQPEVYDARTGKRVELDLDAWFATGYEWLDASTVVLLSQRTRTSPVQLHTCAVPEGSCRVVASDLGSFEELLAGGFALPIGESMED